MNAPAGNELAKLASAASESLNFKVRFRVLVTCLGSRRAGGKAGVVLVAMSMLSLSYQVCAAAQDEITTVPKSVVALPGLENCTFFMPQIAQAETSRRRLWSNSSSFQRYLVGESFWP